MVEPVLRLRCLKGFSLLELVVVIALLAVVACLALPLLGSVRADAQMDAAKATLSAIRESILGSSDRPGYLADMKCVPGFQEARFRMHDLLDSSSYPSFSNFDPLPNAAGAGLICTIRNLFSTPMKTGRPFSCRDERRFAAMARS